MSAVVLSLRVPVAAPPEVVFAAATDWDRQGEWMLGTRVWPTVGVGRGEGAAIAAFTGVGRLGFLDTMTITRWDPPRACHVLHTGRVVRGTGTFEVEVGVPDAPPGGCVFVWGEVLELPLGALGRLGWPLVRPAFLGGVRRSLRQFARWVESGTPAPR